MRTLPGLIVLLLLSATLHAETGLSIQPLAKALQNPALDGDDPGQARQAVQALLLNQPQEPDELERFHERLASLARHRDTRLGRLFFRALETVPDVEQTPPGARRVELLLHRPLALDAVLRVHIGWELVEDAWKVSRMDVGFQGAGAAPVAKAPPYFGTGLIPEFLLDADELDLLVGRDPADRRAPEQEPFDFGAALESYLGVEEGGFEEVVENLSQAVTPETERAARINALKPHLEPAAVRAMEVADADAERRDEFWRQVFTDLKQAKEGPRPSAVPIRAGGRVNISAFDTKPAPISVSSATRLRNGKIAPRAERRKD